MIDTTTWEFTLGKLVYNRTGSTYVMKYQFFYGSVPPNLIQHTAALSWTTQYGISNMMALHMWEVNDLIDSA